MGHEIDLLMIAERELQSIVAGGFASVKSWGKRRQAGITPPVGIAANLTQRREGAQRGFAASKVFAGYVARRLPPPPRLQIVWVIDPPSTVMSTSQNL
jgi:hypothetical protein